SRCRWPVLMHDSEIDSLASVLGQDWGQVSHLLRKAAEHEPFAAQRKGASLFVERPELAICRAGTPGQFLRLIPSSEDGLFSRMAWLYVPAVEEWVSPRPAAGRVFPEDVVAREAERVDALHAALLAREAPLRV